MLNHALLNLLLLLCFSAASHSMVLGQPSDQRCFFAVGDYRNCTCGVQYRIIEQRCCSSESCLQPFLTTENLTCPFECLNGGTYDPVKDICKCSDGYYGVCCQKETPLCGDVFLQDKGQFTSLNFPNRYPSNSRCVWRISTDPGRRIALGIKDRDFDVEPGSNIYSCDYDAVSVYDGNSKDSRQLGRFCGNIDFTRTFKTVYSTGSNMYVEFFSDYIIQRKGFALQYSVFFAGQSCGPLSTYTLPKGTITSPQYPIQYRPEENCEWTIKVLSGNEVILRMNDIDMPAQADCRHGDYLLISGMQISTGVRTDFGVYCGTRAFRPYRINGDYEEIILTFRSNRKVQGRGFTLTYEQVDSSSVSGASNEESLNVTNSATTGPQLLVPIRT